MLDTNDALRADGKLPATYTNLLLGITKASLSTDSVHQLRRRSRKRPVC
jgi:DNA-directed RNA polymerase subunit beta'